MTQTKGVLDAIAAWKKVVEQIPGARLIMAGDGPERERGMLARATARDREVGRMAGVSSPEEEKRRLLAESRVLLAPSREEGWGIAVCEALASGLPVVAYRLPVLDELFDSAYSAADPGQIDDLAARAIAILRDDALGDRPRCPSDGKWRCGTT